MSNVPFYHLDVFTRERFHGNPAGVCVLERRLDDRLMLAIAAEQNLPATAFFVRAKTGFELRWFAPAGELQLCGHATLATSWVLFNLMQGQLERIAFITPAGLLGAHSEADRVVLDFPAMRSLRECDAELARDAIGLRPRELLEADGARGLAVLENPAQVRDLSPSIERIAALPFSALIVTAPGFPGDSDFVSRYFAPRYGVGEDFVTGSAHCVLAPYWAGVLSKARLFARQLSSRGGELWLEDCGERIRIGGQCVAIAEGTLTLENP